MRQYLSKLPRSTEELLRWHERYISPATLLIGFTLDSIALKRVDLWYGNLLLFGYLSVAGIGIFLFHLIQSGKLRGKIFLKLIPFLPALIQFGFGGLFSGFVILYSHSAAYATSWIFVVALAILMIGNERFRTLYTGFVFQASIFFLTLLSFMAFFLPVVVGRIGTGIFLASEVITIAATTGLLYGFYRVMPLIYRDAKWRLFRSLASILLIFNVLYFTNAIPPLPLALKESDVAHSVTRTSEGYVVEVEPLPWYQKYLRYNRTFHHEPGEDVYVFTAIFAPTRLTTNILHEWETYDEKSGKWMRSGTFGFQITGGRDGGYRGYSLKESIEEGEWRVNVRTSGGKLVGRVTFRVVAAEEAPVTVKKTY